MRVVPNPEKEAINKQIEAIGVATDLGQIRTIAYAPQPTVKLLKVEVGSHESWNRDDR